MFRQGYSATYRLVTYPFYQRSTPPFSGRRGVPACLLRLRLFLHSHDTKKQNAVLAMKKRKK